MNCKAALLVVAICLEACATTRVIVPASQPATMEVDFSDIPLSRCHPALRGMFVSYAGADALLRDHDHEVTECRKRTIDAEAQRDVERTKTRSSESDRQWAAWGKVGAVVVGVLVIVAGVFVGRELTR